MAEHKPFDARDLARLITHRSRLPGAEEGAAAGRGPCRPHDRGVRCLGPAELLAAWG